MHATWHQHEDDPCLHILRSIPKHSSKYCFAFSNSPVCRLSRPNANNVAPTPWWSLSPCSAQPILKDSSKHCFAFSGSPVVWLSWPNACKVAPTSGWSLSPCSAQCFLSNVSKYCHSFSKSPDASLTCPNTSNVTPIIGWSPSPCSARNMFKDSCKYCFAFSKFCVCQLRRPIVKVSSKNCFALKKSPELSLSGPNACKLTQYEVLSPNKAISSLKDSSKYCFAFSKSPVSRLSWPNAFKVTPTSGWSMSPCRARSILKDFSKYCFACSKSFVCIQSWPKANSVWESSRRWSKLEQVGGNHDWTHWSKRIAGCFLAPFIAWFICHASSKCSLAPLESLAWAFASPSLWRIFARSGWFFCGSAHTTPRCSSNSCNSFRSAPLFLVSVVTLAEKAGCGADGAVGWVSSSESSSACSRSNIAHVGRSSWLELATWLEIMCIPSCNCSNSSTFRVAVMMRPQADVHSARASRFATLLAKSRICSKIWNTEPLVLSWVMAHWNKLKDKPCRTSLGPSKPNKRANKSSCLTVKRTIIFAGIYPKKIRYPVQGVFNKKKVFSNCPS